MSAYRSSLEATPPDIKPDAIVRNKFSGKLFKIVALGRIPPIKDTIIAYREADKDDGYTWMRYLSVFLDNFEVVDG